MFYIFNEILISFIESYLIITCYGLRKIVDPIVFYPGSPHCMLRDTHNHKTTNSETKNKRHKNQSITTNLLWYARLFWDVPCSSFGYGTQFHSTFIPNEQQIKYVVKGLMYVCNIYWIYYKFLNSDDLDLWNYKFLKFSDAQINVTLLFVTMKYICNM